MPFIAKTPIRSVAVAVAMLALAASANALTLATGALVADSVQVFSQEALDAYDVAGVTVAAAGTATQGATAGAFVLPVTTITFGSGLKISSGQANGSALEISRTYRGAKRTIILANFKIDYVTKQVLADTIYAGVSLKLAPVYTFNVATPLAIKYKFPLSISTHEVLDQLVMTPDMVAAMTAGLSLTRIETLGLNSVTTFGTLTQDVSVKFRRKAIPNKPFVATL